MKMKSLSKEKLSKVYGGAERGRRNYFYVECLKCHEDQRDERRLKYKFSNSMEATRCQDRLIEQKKKCPSCGNDTFRVSLKPFTCD